MTSRTVTTNTELDAALADTVDCIIIDSPSDTLLTVANSGSSRVAARGSSHVEARGLSTIEARGSSSVEAWDSSIVTASKSVTVHLHSAAATVTGGVVIDITERTTP